MDCSFERCPFPGGGSAPLSSPGLTLFYPISGHFCPPSNLLHRSGNTVILLNIILRPKALYDYIFLYSGEKLLLGIEKGKKPQELGDSIFRC